jgi:hypothetical protein
VKTKDKIKNNKNTIKRETNVNYNHFHKRKNRSEGKQHKIFQVLERKELSTQTSISVENIL